MTNADGKSAPSWVGPVAAAVALAGGYIGYDQWREGSRHDRECANLKRQFQSNMNAMLGPAEDAIQRSREAGNQAPMADLSGSVAANKTVFDELNANCPGWIEGAYD